MFDQKLDNGPQGGEANDWKDLKFIIAKSAILFIRMPINKCPYKCTMLLPYCPVGCYAISDALDSKGLRNILFHWNY